MTWSSENNQILKLSYVYRIFLLRYWLIKCHLICGISAQEKKKKNF